MKTRPQFAASIMAKVPDASSGIAIPREMQMAVARQGLRRPSKDDRHRAPNSAQKLSFAPFLNAYLHASEFHPMLISLSAEFAQG